jgi:hypothetical protein
MSVLVDDAAWPWRGDRWAHLTSDVSFEELHVFANRLGVRRLAFQDDHYDVPESLRDLALQRGAVPVSSRALVASLRATGMRVRGRRVAWREVDPHDPSVAAAVAPVLEQWRPLRDVTWTSVLRRPRELALTASSVPEALAGPAPAVVAGMVYIVERPEGRIMDVVLPVVAE